MEFGINSFPATAPKRGCAGLEFRILGPVEIRDGRTGLRTVPTGVKQRALLGALVVKAGQVVSVHRLIDELWGEHPPANATNALQAHVTRLRRLLPVPEPGSGTPHHEWIVSRSLGYVLRLGPADTDAGRFLRLAAEGRAVAISDPERAAGLLRRALALWRGPALEGSGRGDICSAEASQLQESRLIALETLYDACLRASRHGEIISELEELTTDHPLRERFYDLLMTALYRCGRQAEALSVYDRARKRLVHELGVEPGPVLRGRMESILHHDPELGLATHRGPGGPVRPVPASCGEHLPATAAATSDSEATVLSLRGEIARLRRHIERLSREQEDLINRFDQLSARPAAGQ